MCKKNVFFTTVCLSALLVGCGGDSFEAGYTENELPVILSCSGRIELPTFPPSAMSRNPARNATESWFESAFKQHVPDNVFDYIAVPDYVTVSPKYIQERAIEGNTMPYGDHALSFHYLNESYELKDMNLYFDRYSSLEEQVWSSGRLTYGYHFWAVAPAEARYIGLQLHDRPLNWRYFKGINQHMDQIEEVWFARQADAFTRASWSGSTQDVSPEGRASVAGLNLPENVHCTASPYAQSRRNELSMRDYAEDGSEWVWREERRESNQRAQKHWLSTQVSRTPAQLAPEFIPGTATSGEKQLHFFPRIAITADDFINLAKDGELSQSWADHEWRSPLSLWQEDWPHDGNF